MQIVIEIPDAPIEDYQDLLYKIHGMAAREGLFDDKEKSQRALVLKVVLDILGGIVNGTPLPKGHGRLKDENEIKRMIETSKVNSEHSKTFAENIIRFAPTIIEADKEQEDDNT